MLNVDNQEWWMWQMYRASAEFMREPNNDREARLKFFMSSYRYFHQQQSVAQEDTTALPLVSTFTTNLRPSLDS